MIYVLSGGGASLNYKVVGDTTAPSSPQENTIWVNTSVAITSYVFSAKVPTSPTEGMVWFPSGSTSKAPFNALKKNGLWVFPVACQQYVSNEWVYRTTKTWQGGQWIDWEMYLYNAGNQCTDVTGGWISSGATGNVTFNDTDIYIKSTSAYENGQVSTVNKIDLTNFSSLKVTITVSNVKDIDGNVKAFTKNEAGASVTAATVNLSHTALETTTNLDVSGLNGEYFIGITATGTESSYYMAGKFHVTKVILEV